MASLELEDVHLSFRVTDHGPVQFSDWLLNRTGFGRLRPIQTVRSLRGVSLSLRDGDRVGLIGKNGAGKSTLMRVMAGIYPIDSGRLTVEGRIGTMLSVLNGVEGYATGWENIRSREYLRGESWRAARERQREIGEFSGLGEHLRRPVNNLSTGMKVRLGFAIATSQEPDILILDECVNAGDLAFRERARRRLDRLVERSSILVVASHDHSLVKQLCRTVVWMEEGKVRRIGAPDEVIEAFETSALAAAA